MKKILTNDKGIAMVMTLAYISALVLLAAIIVVLAVSERRTSFNEYNFDRSFYSADAGSEAAINWLRTCDAPPKLLDSNKHVYIPSGYNSLGKGSEYRFNITYMGKRNKPGWGLGYKEYEYNVVSQGKSIQESETEVGVQARRLFKEGY